LEIIFNIVILGLDPRIQTTLTPPLDSRFRGNDKLRYINIRKNISND
jgi:hypothetical protein